MDINWYFPISALVNGVVFLFLGLFVYLKDYKKKINQTFFVFTLSVVVWAFCYFIWQLSSEESNALFWSRALMIGSIFIAPTYIHFILSVLNKKKKTFLVILYVIAFIFFILNFTSFFVNKVQKELFFTFWPRPGIAFHFFLVYQVALICYAIYHIYIRYHKEQGIKREQLKLIFVASIIGYVAGFTNHFLWYEISFPPYLNILVSVYGIMIAYAILKYRFLDIRVMIRRGLVYSILIFIIVGFCSFLILIFGHYSQDIFQLNFIFTASIIAFLIALLFQPLARILNKGFEQAMFQEAAKYKYSIKKAKELFKQNFELKRLQNDLRKLITINLGLAEFVFCALKRKNKRFEEVMAHNEQKKIVYLISENDQFIQALKLWPENIIIKEEIPYLLAKRKYSVEQKEALKQIEDRLLDMKKSLLLKIFIGHELIGLIFGGEREEKKAYSIQDIKFLKDILEEAGPALNYVLQYVEAIEKAGIADKV